MNILTADIGSTFTKLTAIDLDKEVIMGTSSAFTTIQTDVMEGFSNALEQLKKQVKDFSYNQLICCSSAAGGLKMVALGLVPELTAKAAKLAAASAGAKVVKTYSFEISQEEQKEINAIDPDLVLLCGGTDGGNKDVIIANAQRLCDVGRSFTTIVAGNKSATSQIEQIFTASGKPFVITQNVMPEFNKLNIEPAQKQITELFIHKIIEAKGLSKIQQLSNYDIIPTPLAVLNGCKLLSTGTKTGEGIGDLMAVDLGGATTDVYSIADGKPTLENVTVRGLPEPFSKRTVEGDLGMRYSLSSLAETVDLDAVSNEMGLNVKEVKQWVEQAILQPHLLPKPSSTQEKAEQLLAHNAVRVATERHVGTFQSVYTPFGQVFALTGKDLSAIPYVVGIGGAIINSHNPEQILGGVKWDSSDFTYAKPHNPKYVIDKGYIFSAMGLLSSHYPDVALNILKRELKRL